MAFSLGDPQFLRSGIHPYTRLAAVVQTWVLWDKCLLDLCLGFPIAMALV